MRFKMFSFYADGKGNSRTAAGNGKIQSPKNKVKRDISSHNFKSNSLHLDKMQDTENIWDPAQNRERRVSQNNDFFMNSITSLQPTSTKKKELKYGELFSKRSHREKLGKRNITKLALSFIDKRIFYFYLLSTFIIIYIEIIFP